MKQIIFLTLITFTLLFIHVFPQEECGTVIPPGVTIQQAQSGDLSLYKRSSMTPALRLAIHIVRASNGTGGISQTNLDEKIAALNNIFQQAYFQFEVLYTDYIDNDQFYSIDGDNEAAQLLTTGSKYGFINIYFVNSLNVNGGAANGVSTFSPRINTSGIHGMIIRNGAPLTTLPHEMGHYFDLFHIHEVYFGFENIARTGGCANWNSTGDLLMDTPADPSGRVIYATINHNGCIWINPPLKPLPLDGCGQNNYSPLSDNMMHTQVANCRTTFTVHQIDRMSETLELYRYELFQSLAYIENRINGQDAGGTINIGNNTYQSGDTVFLDPDIYTFRTNVERFSNFQGSGLSYKHNNWNTNSSEFYLEHSDYIFQNYVEQIANFDTMRYSKVSMLLEGVEIPDKGNFEFKDPWYVKGDGTQPGDYWTPCISSYEPTGKYGAPEKGVFLNQFIEEGLPYYSVQAISPQDISLSQTGKTHRFYFRNWEYDQNTIELDNPNSLQTGIVFKDAPAILNANMKGTQLSNYSSAFSNNGQRMAIKTHNDELLLVYESMGRIWFEHSTNNGTSWGLLNNNEPISASTAKHPSITQVGQSQVIIAYQALNSDGTSYSIIAVLYDLAYNQVINQTVITNQIDKLYSEDATVTIGCSRSGITDFLIVWREEDYGTFLPGGLYYWLGHVVTNQNNPNGTIEMITNGMIGSTTTSSVNPTIGCKFEQITYPVKFHLVWQNNVDTSTSTIKYREITYNGQQLTLSTEQVLSNGSGYTKNHNPSTTVMNDNIPRVTWRGERTVIHEEEEILNKIQSTTTESKVLFTDPSVSYFWGFGSNVGKPTINRSTDNLKYYMGWSEPYQGTRNGKSVDNTLNSINIKTLSGLTGTDIQVVNGATGSQMYAVSLNNSSGLPYYFQISNVVPSQMEKEELVLSGIGREGVVYNGSAQFYFMIGDVIVNGSEVDFVDVPASTVFSSDSVLNRYMQTETFTLNNSSEFLYSVQYGVTDSAAVADYLQDGNSISFAVELIDATTGALLGKFDEVTFNSQNIYQYDNLSYEVNTEGIGNREVYLRLATNNNGNVSRSLTIVGADASLIAKRHTKKVGFNGIAAVTDYALSQNYPNPFNPVTTINYQIPKDGFVSLKVYDILGKEIATLVNSDKAQGKYTVEFDGSRFASGMYIYKLQSGDFVETRKMMLLK